MALSAKARQAALTIAIGGTQAQAAERVGVNVRTVRVWAARAEFKAEVARLTDDLIDRSIARKVGLLNRADRRLKKLIEDPDARVATRAVKIAYESLMSMRTHGEIRARLDQIQETLRHGGNHGWDTETDTDADGTEPDTPEG
jgi:hypothetical protein